MTHGKAIGIVQPTYLPWLPFFERWAASDVFVLLDDVEYSKNSFFNRNAIKVKNGRQLLTIPVIYKGSSHALIKDIKVNMSVPWVKKHWSGIAQAYSKAAYWSRYEADIHDLYHQVRSGDTLLEWIFPFIAFLGRELGMTAPLMWSSALGGVRRQNEKLIDICHTLGGTHFIVKPGTEDYHPPGIFQAEGIALKELAYSHIPYSQLNGPFEKGLSALDYLLTQGPGRPPFAPVPREETAP